MSNPTYAEQGSRAIFGSGPPPGVMTRLPFGIPSRVSRRRLAGVAILFAVTIALLFFASADRLESLYQVSSRWDWSEQVCGGRQAAAPILPHTSHPPLMDLSSDNSAGGIAVIKRPGAYHKSSGRIVVTGGGGNIGKQIVRQLLATSTPVTVLDVVFNQEELDDIYLDYPAAHATNLLHVVLGDIRNASALQQAITEDVVGVVHLAAVSRVLWCLENEADCFDANERGTELILDALTEHGKRRGIQPWFVLASSREVYGNAESFPVAEDAPRTPANVYGASKLKAEEVLERHLTRLNEGGRTTGSLHAIMLRLSNVYGGQFDHLERLVPNIATQALSHLPIQIVGGAQNLDMLHIDDCVDAFLLAINKLGDLSAANWFGASRTSIETFNVATGKTVLASELINKLLHLARSKSPIQYLKADDRFPDRYVGSTEKAERGLGFRAQVSIDEGLLRLVGLYLQRTEKYLTRKISSQCYANSPHPTINTQLEKLDDCMVHVTMSVQGRLAALASDGHRFFVNDKFPPPPFDSTIKRADDGKFLIKLRQSERPHLVLGLHSAGNHSGSVHDAILDKQEKEADGFWEIDANPELAAMMLILPGSAYQLSPPNYLDGNLTLVPRDAKDWPVKITPICCPAPAPWPFAAEDPVEHSIDFLRTSTLIQFSSSIPKALCHRMTKSLEKVKRDLATLSWDVLDPSHKQQTTLGGAGDWSNAQLPACTNLCDHPTICLDTGDCQCTLSVCPVASRFPFSSVANLPRLSYPSEPASLTHPEHDGSNRLLDTVKHSSWLNVLRPHASRYIGTGDSWPKIHVAGYAPRMQAWLDTAGKDVDKLQPKNCFSADAAMEHALREIGVPASEADMVFLPHYQRRRRLFDDDVEYLYSTIPGLNPRNVVIPFTHDYGVCSGWDWTVWNMRKRFGRIPAARDIVAWSVNADVNTPCFNPLQDVTIPPRTCATPQLYAAFQNMANVRPARQRALLATFKGSYWGTGANTRRKLNCELRMRTLENREQLKLQSPHKLNAIWGSLGHYESYPAILNDTIFCPLPEGVSGWATRLADAIYAGCIPVFIGHSSQYPFFDMLDWSTLSITVEREDLQRMERVLMGYSMEEVERLQANLMLVRDAFLYPLDGNHADQLTMRGPLFFTMHSTKMRMLTQYPSSMLVDRPDWRDR
ncbi:glycosyltransferase family 47 protein [Calocera viscosa TUFC12733]|uniref:Glycosyltransferase family 47 protein n=1 Tax=Calocera viscosa (strain TUFC12733) TaxID=1330018 RepID=A0A167QHJ3_CALVF|nr:glycosyltransferase family 47 protein [Calocera viscosa TUFC12733]